ncbi:hypothetical protein DIS24_g11372 [Lasiodiplodia hormozganensis]|uniref:Uncharacterized protein n=1 Tax=Lasiodiplodia hormozganensis TaxID=869390 RepID=A0AA40C200_9PEZI|nr:hypothetical protein DIS24_g11372 [Lasiodiplodia hormozganensis]
MPVTLPNELVLLTLEYSLVFETPTKLCKQAQITPESAKDILTFRAVSRTFAKLADNLLPKVLQQKRVQMTAADLDMLDRFTRREAVSNRMSALCISTAFPVDLPRDYDISNLQEQATKQWSYYPSATEALTTIASRLVNLKDVAIEGDPKRLIGEDCKHGYAELVEHMGPQASYAVMKALSDAGRAPAKMEISRWPLFAQGFSELGNESRFTFPSIMQLEVSFIDTGRATSSEEEDLYDHARNILFLYDIFPNLADLRVNMIPAGGRTYSLFKNPQRLPWFLWPCITTLTRLELAMNQCTQYFAMAYRNKSSLRHLALYNTEDRHTSADGIIQYISTRLLYHGQLETLYLQFPTQSFTNEDLRHIPIPLIVWGHPPTPFTKRIYIRQLPLGYEDSPEDAHSSLGGGVEGWGGVFPGDFEMWLGERDDLRLKKVWAPMMLPTPSPN